MEGEKENIGGEKGREEKTEGERKFQRQNLIFILQ